MQQMNSIRVNSIRAAGRQASHNIGQKLRAGGFSRERWPRVYALLDIAFEPLGTSEAYDRIYVKGPDPWNYQSDPAQRERYWLAVELLDRVRNGRRFQRALEIGCAEGAFTERLALRCQSLVAADFSQVALIRALNRRQWEAGVTFETFDLRREPLPGRFELVVAMDMLAAFRRPGVLRAARDRMVEGLCPEGYLMVTENWQHPLFESAWWARRLLRGGKWIVSDFAQHRALDLVAEIHTATHILALFRKRPAAP
jgi:cyclopropane fatty-acyl-phospholipid synthase-like methyltransferase